MKKMLLRLANHYVSKRVDNSIFLLKNMGYDVVYNCHDVDACDAFYNRLVNDKFIEIISFIVLASFLFLLFSCGFVFAILDELGVI